MVAGSDAASTARPRKEVETKLVELRTKADSGAPDDADAT